MNRETFVQSILDCGATKAAIIQQDQIVLSASFRDVCRDGMCGGYGRCWMCPPDIGDIEPLMEAVRSYPQGILYQTIGTIEDSYDFEGMREIGKRHEEIGIQIQKTVSGLLKAPFLHLSCGGCRLCERCARLDDLPCRHPDLALPPMEGYGIDVYNTTSSTDLKYINGTNTVTYFGLVLFQEESWQS